MNQALPGLRGARVLLISTLACFNLFAPEVDPRMVPPRDGVRGKLPAPSATPARESAKTFRVLDGFRMDLLASEPMVASPVAMAYDEDGRAYVCEMRDYPYTDKAHHQRNQENPTDQAIGSVRLLEDRDGDGIFDKETMFAEGLSWPTGVACWKGGVFIAVTPDIWYCKDTDGDGRADVRRKVFTGFRKFNVQSVMNTLVWGLDHRIHGAGSSNGGQIRPAANPQATPLVMGRNDFCFEPVTEEFEVLSGGARFGGAFDDWGRRFLCDIRNPAQHVVLPRRYLERNPYLAVSSVLHDMAESGDQLPVYRLSPPEAWRVIRAKRWAGERDIVMPRSELVGAGVVTSSSGITSYRGGAYPAKYRDNVFVCECAGNLFYRLKLTPAGATFNATRVDGPAEMVASTDNWFRPVNFVNAPDGTLHVMDMYRENIEHPWSIPDDIHAAVDLESGRDRGRLWRLAPPGFKVPPAPRLSRATTAELVATLENPNSWWRETAQRLLLERQALSAEPALRHLVKRGPTGQARLHALWTLAGLKKLAEEDVLAGLQDSEAGVRENAVMLAERHLASGTVRTALLKLVSDPEPRVRFQLALTLGEIDDPRTASALAAMGLRDGSDSWTRAALLSSVNAATIGPLLADGDFIASGNATELLRALGQMVGARGQLAEMQAVLRGGSRKSDIVIGLGEGLKRSGQSLRRKDWDVATREAIEQLFAQAGRTALEAQAPLEARVAAIRLLTFDAYERVGAILAGLLNSKQPQELQRAAVAALGSFAQAETAPILLANWRASAPSVRSEIVLAMLNGRNRVLPLLQAIERGEIPAHQVPFARRAALLRSADKPVKELAANLFGGVPSGSRQDTLGKYQAALAMQGDAARGRTVFETACAACHRLGELGQDVGPNLATIRHWNPEQVLINILDPNREVAPNFLGYTVETKDGRTLDGLIVEESVSSITLKRSDGVTETVLRRDVAQLAGSGLSLMPEGLENAVTIGQMADLIAFLLPAP
jgi:putative membrane-bound dehydrogenase-like protein